MASKDIIVFDFDGTLVDTLPTVLSIINTLREDLNKAALGPADLIPLISKGGNSLIKGSLDIDESQVDFYKEQFRSRYLEDSLSRDQIYPGAIFVLKKLKQQGKKLYLCSNKPKILLEKSLKAHNLNIFFDGANGGDSSIWKKPNPMVLEGLITEKWRGLENVLIVGDSSYDRQLAQNAGISFYFFSGGYNDDCGSYTEPSFKHYSEFKLDSF